MSGFLPDEGIPVSGDRDGSQTFVDPEQSRTDTVSAGKLRCRRVGPFSLRVPTDRTVNYMLKAAVARAGISEKFSARWLRHAHASHAIE
jgi:hypothetical protein